MKDNVSEEKKGLMKYENWTVSGFFIACGKNDKVSMP